MAVTDALLGFRQFSEAWGISAGKSFYGEMLQVEGLQEESMYHVFMGEMELGSYTGAELIQGIDLAESGNHPLGTCVWQMEEQNR